MIINRNNEELSEHFNHGRNGQQNYRLLSQEEVAAGKESHWFELEISGCVRNLSPSMWKLTHLTSLYLHNNSLTRLPSSISRLIHLKKLDLSFNKLRTLPAEIGDLIQLRELLLANNYLRQLPYEMGKLFQLQILVIKGNPLAHDILAVYNEHNGTRKLLDFMLDNLHVSATTPPPRPWFTCANLSRNRPSAVFSVMCYNVLCDRYATRQMYGYCPQWSLNWEYRKKGILEEIRSYSADLITLQEVETDQFYNYFHPELMRDGYEGVFSPKSRAKTMNENERKRVDGCAIFFKPAKFKLVKEQVIEFNQVAMTHAQGSDVMLNRVMTKDNIALAVLLETRESLYEGLSSGYLAPEATCQSILLATAHIHWDPEFCDVKLIQTMMLVDQLKRMVDDQPRPASSVQLLLCGDFNSLPDSGVIEYIQNGRIRADHRDFKNLAYKKSLCKMISHSSDEENYNHQFAVTSAIKPEVMPYTNYTYDFKGMIDYIFYPERTMIPLGFLGPVDSHWLRENKVVGCPHPHMFSDHFSLLVELAMPLPLGNLNGMTSPNPTLHLTRQQQLQQQLQQLHQQQQQQQQQQHFYNPTPISTSAQYMNNFMSYPGLNNGMGMQR